MKKGKIYRGKNLSLAFGFCLVILAILLVYFCWKAVKIVSQSRFDGNHEYILGVKEANNTQDIIAFLPDTQTINVVAVANIPSGADITKITQLPVDGYIATRHVDTISSLLQSELFSSKKHTLPIVDIIKLWLFTHSVQQTSFSNQTLSFPVSQATLDNIIPKLFIDKSLYQDAQTIAIVNASGVPGAGNRFAKFLTNIGANVIIVNTADSLQNTTTLTYGGDYTYTVSRMQKILNVSAIHSQKKLDLQDITITIGTDKAGQFN